MISRLVGTLIEKTPPTLVLDVNGVGYSVFAPMTTFYQLPSLGSQTILHIHFVVRDDAQLLYGFSQTDDRRLFRTIIKVNGVGPKIALAILSNMNAETFVRCIRLGDVRALVSLPGVGQKVAKRLIVELKSELDDWSLPLVDQSDVEHLSSKLGGQAEIDGSLLVNEALNALLALGYKLPQAKRAVLQVKHQAESLEELIRLALQRI